MKKYGIIFGGIALSMLITSVAYANHSWRSYHWARTSNPLVLKLGNNLTATWGNFLQTASSDWSLSSVLDTAVVGGQSNPKNCKPTSGRVEVCNSKYGNNGWLGIAQIWISGNHITQGVTKMNDTYFNTARYNTPKWKQFVICQEVGHTLGLDHQDEDFTNDNLGTCMDYTSNPSTNQHPNQHDYDQLEAIYAHFDSINTAKNAISSAKARDLSVAERMEWGKEVRKDKKGNGSVYELDLKNGEKVYTFVVWTE